MGIIVHVRPSHWPLVTLFVISVVLQSLDRSLLAAVQPSIMSQFGLDQRGYGRLVAAYSIPYGLSAPIMGMLIDRFGFPRVSAIAVSVWSLASLATGFAGSVASLTACRSFLGVAEAAGLPAAGKVYSTYLLPKDRSLGTALNQVVLTVGSVLAVLMAGWLAPRYGWRSTFCTAGVLGLLWAGAWSIRIRAGFSHSLHLNAAVPVPIRRILSDRRMWALLAANILTMPLYTLWANWTTSYLVNTYGLGEAETNLRFAGLPPVFAMAGGLAAGWLTRVLSTTGKTVQPIRYRVCLIGAAGILVTALIPLAATPGLAAIGIGTSFFFTVWISVNVYAMTLDMFGESRAGFAFSMLTGVYGLMAAVVSTQLGSLIDQHGFAPACYAGSVLPGFGLLLLRMAGCHR